MTMNVMEIIKVTMILNFEVRNKTAMMSSTIALSMQVMNSWTSQAIHHPVSSITIQQGMVPSLAPIEAASLRALKVMRHISPGQLSR